MKKIFCFFASLLFTVSLFGAVYAPELKTDFKDKASLSGTIGSFYKPAALHIIDTADGNKALEVMRGRDHYFVQLKRPLRADEDFGYSLTLIRPDKKSTLNFGMENAKREYTAMVYAKDDGNLAIYNNKTKRYVNSGIKLEVGKKYTVNVFYSSDTNIMTVAVPGNIPVQQRMEAVKDLHRFTFSPQRTKGNITLVENFRIYCKPGKITRRENGAVGSPVEAPGIDKKELAKLTDGKINTLAWFPEEITIEFPLHKRINATAIQIYGGDPIVRMNASTACAPRAYIIEANVNGSWTVIAKADDAPDVCAPSGIPDSERMLRHDFKVTPIDALRIKLLKSHDSGKRMGGRTAKPEDRGTAIREIEILSDKEIEVKGSLNSLLMGEFVIPVFRDKDKADFTIIAAQSEFTPLKGTATIADPSGKIIRTMELKWKYGKNNIVIDKIGDYAPGRYMMTLKTTAGELKRLLRIEKTPPITAPAAPLKMTGKKFFFTPDKFTFKEWKNLDISVDDTETFMHTKTPSPDKYIMSSNGMFRTKDGRYAIESRDLVHINPYATPPTKRYMVSDSLTKVFTTQVDKLPPLEKSFTPFKDFHRMRFRMAPFKPDMEVYDPAKHGKIDLRDIGIYYTRYNPKDLGKIKTYPRHYYMLGKTASGEQVLMNPKHILHDFSPYGENDFDNGFMTNDNFGSMWLSPDGKECLLAHGQTMKRCPPYTIPYDNLSTGVRLMTVYSSTDGINWKLRNVMTLPEPDESYGAQHYSAKVRQLAHGDLFIAEMANYDGAAQQIYIELAYSRDGIYFHRFKDRKPFVKTEDPESWFFGHVFFTPDIIKEGKYYYQQAGYCTNEPHFYYGVTGNRPLPSITGEHFRKRFEDLNITSWPYFDKVGGYEGMAKYARESYYASGVVRYRADGWFGLIAKDKEGTFSTNLMNAEGKLTANAKVAKDGYIKLELCSADGKVIESKNISGDDLNIPVFDKLPEGDFFIRGTMKNAKLYTLYFE